MITDTRGNLLVADVDALVNTVNTVGVMGKGIALQFKRAYPAMFKDYARAVERGELALGRMHVWETGLLDGPRYIINFPTKGHWRSPSRLVDIEAGLDDLVRFIHEVEITSIAVPPLGCGNGGLDWSVVQPVIRASLGRTGIDIRLFAPEGTPRATEMLDASAVPTMTTGRAALIELMARYSRHALEDPSLIETQKLMYFLQAAGEPLKLDFVPHHFGPYADNLRHVLRTVEGHYLSGFGDGSAPVQQAERLSVMTGALDAAADHLAHQPATKDRIDLVMTLVDGFESAYALELLASVHWALAREPELVEDTDGLVATVRSWSARKKRVSTPSTSGLLGMR